MTEPSWDERVETERRRVEDALSTAMQNLKGGMVTKFVAVFEWMDTDGDRDVSMMATDGLMRWDVHGLLDWYRESSADERLIARLRADDE